MECVEAAAAPKSSLSPEIGSVKSTEKTFSEDEFFVDGLLDFSNEDVGGFIKEKGGENDDDDEDEDDEEEEDEEEEKDGSCISFSVEEAQNSNSSVRDDFGAVLGSALDVPADDLADLEWLSHFVDDSFSEFPSSSDSFPYNPENKTETETETETVKRSKPEPETVFLKARWFGLATQVRKARSKRSRISRRGWSYGGPRFTESSPSSSSSSCSSSSLSFSSCLVFPRPSQNPDHFYSLGKPPLKKQNRGRKPAVDNSQRQQPQRRCTHCLVQKTPQWRAGPLGPKTLCNACGVRYKSGRLLPEYRPAGSPTFSSDVHSNSHRKVLEMRRKKELCMPAVQSF